MSELETNAQEANVVTTYWDVARGQFEKKRVAVFALRCVYGLIFLAVGAPILCMNIPYVLKNADGLSFPLFEKLFDVLVFPSGVDRFFNLLLVMWPVWACSGKIIRALGLIDGQQNIRRVRIFGGVLALILALQVAVALTGRGIFGRLLLCNAIGIGFQLLQAHRGRHLQPRYRARVQLKTRFALAALLLIVFTVSLKAWSHSGKLVLYRVALEKQDSNGWAISPPLFHHPSQVAESSEFMGRSPLQPPSGEHLLGTDRNSRDVLARLIFGTRISMTIGIIAVSIYTTIGIILGGLAGYFGGWIDMSIISALQVMLCIPTLFLLLTIIAVFKTSSIFMIMVAIGLTSWTGVTRLVRGEFLRQKGSDYVMAAKALGIPERKIIFGHILKNSLGPVLVAAAFGVAGAILAESFLSFIGLGDANAPSWGQVLQAGRATQKIWLIVAPGMAIFFVVTVLNLVGDGIRDALDPKMRK